jgi:asparagine synthase (glutamine-hydrolysing)
MAGKIPDSIVSRSKQAYRAPISINLMNKDSGHFNNYLSGDRISESGIFDKSKVNRLLKKLETGKNISEVDNMALIAIFSTQVIDSLFIKNRPSLYKNHKLDNLKTVIRDY